MDNNSLDKIYRKSDDFESIPRYYSVSGVNVNSCCDILSSIILKALQKEFNELDDLSNLHHFVSPSNVNTYRLKLFNLINKDNLFDLFTSSFEHDIKKMIGPDLIVQKSLNLSIQMPNDNDSTLFTHIDAVNGDSPFQLVCWLPLTDCFETNSMFIMSHKRTMEHLKAIKLDLNADSKQPVTTSPVPNKRDYLNLKRGEAIIFNPLYLHGNSINKTDKTRLSINLRFKNFFTPEYSTETNPDRSLPAYYKIYNLTDFSLLGLSYITFMHGE